MKYPLALFALACLVSCQSPDPKAIFTEDAPRPIGPYSQAIRHGQILYVSGQIGLKADGTLDTTSFESETKQVMENLRAVIEAAGASMDRVCKATIYTTDLSQFSTINTVYGSYFGGAPPARETVEVRRLPKGARVEISVVAMY